MPKHKKHYGTIYCNMADRQPAAAIQHTKNAYDRLAAPVILQKEHNWN